jgi:hypothetical protein
MEKSAAGGKRIRSKNSCITLIEIQSFTVSVATVVVTKQFRNGIVGRHDKTEKEMCVHRELNPGLARGRR